MPDTTNEHPTRVKVSSDQRAPPGWQSANTGRIRVPTNIHTGGPPQPRTHTNEHAPTTSKHNTHNSVTLNHGAERQIPAAMHALRRPPPVSPTPRDTRTDTTMQAHTQRTHTHQ